MLGEIRRAAARRQSLRRCGTLVLTRHGHDERGTPHM